MLLRRKRGTNVKVTIEDGDESQVFEIGPVNDLTTEALLRGLKDARREVSAAEKRERGAVATATEARHEKQLAWKNAEALETLLAARGVTKRQMDEWR
jgi:hypothetical protein